MDDSVPATKVRGNAKGGFDAIKLIKSTFGILVGGVDIKQRPKKRGVWKTFGV